MNLDLGNRKLTLVFVLFGVVAVFARTTAAQYAKRCKHSQYSFQTLGVLASGKETKKKTKNKQKTKKGAFFFFFTCIHCKEEAPQEAQQMHQVWSASSVTPVSNFVAKAQSAKRKNDFDFRKNHFCLIRSLTSIIFIIFFVFFFFFFLLNHLRNPSRATKTLSTRFALVVICRGPTNESECPTILRPQTSHMEMVRPWSTRMKRQCHPSGSMIAQCVFVEEI